MNKGVFGHPKGGGRAGILAPFPWLVEIHPWEPTSAQSGGWQFVLTSGRLYDGEWINNSTSLATDYLEWPVVLAAGTWSLQIVGTKFSDAAILAFSLDSAPICTIDQYAASAQISVIQRVDGINVSGSGKKLLRLATSTRNVSSSGFFARLVHISLVRTA